VHELPDGGILVLDDVPHSGKLPGHDTVHAEGLEVDDWWWGWEEKEGGRKGGREGGRSRDISKAN
jgi:hypothetical protein